eukprot:94384_1
MGNKTSNNPTLDVYCDNYHISDTYQPLPMNKFPNIIDKNGLRSCIMFYNGTFCPIHYGHINVIESAKKYLESNGFYVLCAYLSPSYNGYCRNKMNMKNEPYISHFDRLNLIQIAINNLSYCMVDTNEMFAPKFYSNFIIIKQLYNRLLNTTKLKENQFDII